MDEKDTSEPSAALGSSEPSAALMNRLAAERADAHRRYNEALTILDRAIQAMPAWPPPPPGYDEQKLPDLNAAFKAMVEEPAFDRQIAFNAALVEHLNRNAVAHRQAHAAIAQAVVRLKESSEALVTFESRLVQFLQQITPLADAHYREIHDAIDQLKTITAVAQRAAMAAQRAQSTGAPGAAGASGAKGAKGAEGAPVVADALIYVAFEDRFRGSEEEIRARQKDYVQYFVGQSDVADVGCGRGEFLELLRDHGISARGVDLNPEMVALCTSRGLTAAHADARAYLRSQATETLGGVIALQVIEHLEPAHLAEFLSLAHDKLRPGATIVLETINPSCWVAFFESFIRDLTHVKPIHPETLQYLLQASGFSDVQIVYRSPIAEGGKLRRVTPRPEHFGDTAQDPLTELVSSFNSNVDRLNARMFSYQDFAAIARKS
jgi:O-antigen chain-terminating methyltransferase